MPAWLRFRKRTDRSLTWFSRTLILLAAFVIGAVAARYGGESVVHWLAWGPGLEDNGIFQSAVMLGLFGVFFGLGNWFIRNDDVKKRFDRAFIEQNELIFSKAARALLEEGEEKRSLRIYGFKEIIRLGNNQSIDKHRIDYVTSGAHDLSRMLMEDPAGRMKLAGFNLSTINFERSNFHHVDAERSILARTNFTNSILEHVNLKSADLYIADFRKAMLIDVDFREVNLHGAKLQGASYDDATQFDEGFDPEEHGMVKI